MFYDAIIIGGGVNGSSIAYYLSKRGKKVLLLEKDCLASKSSRAAAGMLAAQAELDDDGPLFQFAKKSRAMFPSLVEELEDLSGYHIGLINKGMYKIALTKEQEEELKKTIIVHQNAGEEAEWVSGDELRKREKAISEHVLGGMYIPKDGHLSAYDLSLAFARSAAVLGAEIKEHTKVLDFLIEAGEIKGVVTSAGHFLAENVIVTGGAWSSEILKSTGLHLQASPVKGECFSVKSVKPLIEATIFSHGCYIVPKKNGRIIVGATMVPNTFDQKVTFEAIQVLTERAKKIIPEIVHLEWEKAWAGIRPYTADMMPYLGVHPEIHRLYIATGHFRNGILLSPATGEFIADMIEGKEMDQRLIHAFRVDRSMNLVN